MVNSSGKVIGLMKVSVKMMWVDLYLITIQLMVYISEDIV